MIRLNAICFLMAFAGQLAAIAGATVRVDINPDNGRKDEQTAGWTNWAVRDGASASGEFGGIKVTLRATPGFATGLWKPGLDYGVTMAMDGVYVKGGALEMVLAGLPAGRHSIVTYHNSIWDEPLSSCEILVDGAPKLKGVRQGPKATDPFVTDYAAFDVEATAGKDVVIRFQPEGSGGLDNVIMNGFEIDAIDPAKQISRPFPTDRDEHAPPNPVLAWSPVKAATSHRVYFGTDANAVANATVSSSEYKGETTEPRFETHGLSNFATYYWRVDEILSGQSEPAKGDVHFFRVRHLAFPGAEGYGRFAIGGRGGRVIEVTNLNDDGPGSLRAACDAEGPRTVVFRVGGTIPLKSKIIIRNPYITVAGQTAPGDGICLRGFSFGCLGVHDAIIRYVRLRVGDESGKTLDGMGARAGDNIIYDHCSISWSIDEGFSSRQAKNITFQRCIIAEALNMSVHSHYVGTGKGHSFAGSISGDIGSFHHNLLANCAGRNWSLAGGLDNSGHRLAGRLDIRNNVVYNWVHRTTDGGCLALNFVNNFYIPGPASRVFTLQKPDPGDANRGMRIYMTGNLMEGHPGVNADNWSAAVLEPGALAKVKSDAPLFESYVATQSPQAAYESILSDVGANLPKQDSVDARIIQDVKRRGYTFVGSKTKLPGIIDSQADADAWPQYHSAEPPPDADHDGIPDEWERAHGLNPNDPNDGARDSGDGYTWLEKYLHSIGSHD